MKIFTSSLQWKLLQVFPVRLFPNKHQQYHVRDGVGVWVVSDWGCCDVCFRTDGVGGRSGWWGIKGRHH